jgi:formamidopyrimidine-DNA glycosylase
MLELPEVDMLRREAEREFGGRKVKAVAVADAKVLGQGTTAADFHRIEGAKLTGVGRRGLVLTLGIDGTDAVVVEVGRGVGLRKGASQDAALELSFTQGGPLVVLGGTNGVVHLVTAAELDQRWARSGGLDLVEHAVSWQNFARLLVQRQGPLRGLLTDPSVIEGIGPLYADEILWQSGLRPDRRAERLGSQELRRLYRSTVEVLHESQKAGAATTASNGFTDLAGKPGNYQDQLEVFGRDGKPCRRCRATVVSQKVDGKVCYLCLQCQV